jgi:Na+/proline symporter
VQSQLIFSFLAYFSIIGGICWFSYRKKSTVSDFILGNRSANYWVTAISAHASDMSSWLFMGLPAAILVGGGYKSWASIGLAFFMFLNWHFVAPKLRRLSEKTDSLTLPSLFETHLEDNSGASEFLVPCSHYFSFPSMFPLEWLGWDFSLNLSLT